MNYGPNDLLDQRNTILDDLSRYGAVQVTDLEDGRVQVKFNGKVVVDASGASHTNDQLMIGKDGTSLDVEQQRKDGKSWTAGLSGALRICLRAKIQLQRVSLITRTSWIIWPRRWLMCLTARSMRTIPR